MTLSFPQIFHFVEVVSFLIQSAAFGLMGLAPFVWPIIQQPNTNSAHCRRKNVTICGLCQPQNFLAQYKPPNRSPMHVTSLKHFRATLIQERLTNIYQLELCQIFQRKLNKARRVFCGYIWVYLFLVQTGDVVSRSNPMRHSHFTNHVAMAEGESYITFFKTLLASDHPPPKQTSQKAGWVKEKKMEGVEQKFQDQSFWPKRQLQAKNLVSYIFRSFCSDRSSRNWHVLEQH